MDDTITPTPDPNSPTNVYILLISKAVFWNYIVCFSPACEKLEVVVGKLTSEIIHWWPGNTRGWWRIQQDSNVVLAVSKSEAITPWFAWGAFLAKIWCGMGEDWQRNLQAFFGCRVGSWACRNPAEILASSFSCSQSESTPAPAPQLAEQVRERKPLKLSKKGKKQVKTMYTDC